MVDEIGGDVRRCICKQIYIKVDEFSVNGENEIEH